MKAILFILAFASATAWGATDACGLFQKAVASGTEVQKLKKYIDTNWNYLMNEYPEWATFVGRPEGNDRWTDVSIPALQRRDREAICRRDTLKKIKRASLPAADAVNFDLLLTRADWEVEGQQFDDEYLVMSHLDGIHTGLPDMLVSMPAATVKDYENMLARLAKIPQVIEQHEALLREGLKRKVTPVKMFLERVPSQFDRVLTAKIEDSPIYKPFAEIRGLTDAEKASLQERARKVITETVNPSLTKLRDFVVKEYIPGARQSVSWKDMPNGAAWYAYNVKTQTTVAKTPAELHELGLSEVARITAEMNKVREQVKFKGDIAAFNKFLLTDKRFYFTNKEELLTAYRDIGKRADPELIKVFGKLPRLPYGVREMPEYKAKESPAAYYFPGSREGGRPGYFEANTYDLKARPKWGMEALTLHEAVPGHHLQIALSQEMEGQPDFRKHSFFTAFTEGWALYAESLGTEMGFYKDPYSRYGQLSYEMWRAVRLVVDTGIHLHGWSRDKAIDYMMAQMPKSRVETEVEIDRYISWPGQALAYKVGELKIRELRERAKARLGDKFDLREFHDEVLKNGALPMNVLDQAIETWMARKGKEKTKSKNT